VGEENLPIEPTDEELGDYDRLPRDYDKELHDHKFDTFVCECLSFIVVVIPGRHPLRIAWTNQYKPRRLETPFFIDAWEDRDDDDAREPTIVDLDKHGKTMKKLSVWRPRPLGDDDEGPPNFKIRWCTIHAKSGMFNDINMNTATGDFEPSSDESDDEED